MLGQYLQYKTRLPLSKPLECLGNITSNPQLRVQYARCTHWLQEGYLLPLVAILGPVFLSVQLLFQLIC